MGEARRRVANGFDKAVTEQARQRAARDAELARLPEAVRRLVTTPTDPNALFNQRIPIDVAESLARLEVSGESMKGRLNIYTCETCRGHIVTRDIDTGVTPFMTSCSATEGCNGPMQSSFYRVADQRMRASHVWYRPVVSEFLDQATIAHVNQGGLIMRPAKPEEDY